MKWIFTVLSGALGVGVGGGIFVIRDGMSQYPAPVALRSHTIVELTAPGRRVIPLSLRVVSEIRPFEADPVDAHTAAAGGTVLVTDQLLIPVSGVSASQLNDDFAKARGADQHHEALDIPAPKGAQVVAVADGKIVKLFNSKAGGLTVYQFNMRETNAYYYAHLDRYAAGVKEGAFLKRGDLIGYVGTTGNANPATPHLHFAIFELDPEKHWWKGTPINPFPLLGGTRRP